MLKKNKKIKLRKFRERDCPQVGVHISKRAKNFENGSLKAVERKAC